MSEKSWTKCPKCGGEITIDHEPSYQEYPGATPQPAYTTYICKDPACGWDESVRGHCIEGQENTRGW